MVEFNPDGSIKLPESLAKQIAEREKKLRTERYIKITRVIVSDKPPKKCVLNIQLSDIISDNSFVQKEYAHFANSSEVPSKLNKITDKEFDVEIGTSFRRCSDCCSLIRRLREYMDGRVIEEKGGCSFSQHNFSYEDHF